MKKNNRQTGIQGELQAAAYLEENGYHILAKNFRYRRSEVDLIARKDNILIFIEVKTRSQLAFGYPEESVDQSKVNKVIEGADHYIYEHNWQGPIRFDIISIHRTTGELIHFEDAFY